MSEQRIVTTKAELDALPNLSIIVGVNKHEEWDTTSSIGPWVKTIGQWTSVDYTRPFRIATISVPARVIWTPTD